MNQQTGHNIPVDLISRSLSGEASPEELKRLDEWLDEGDENRNLFRQYTALWEKTGDIRQLRSIDIDSEWDRFREATAFDKPSAKITGMNPFIRLAAAVMTGLILGYSGLLIYRSTRYEKITAHAEVKSISLPDGSSVTLNTGSELKYLKNFRSHSREIELKGEAYFDVIRDSLKPFTVEAKDVIVRVLGTSFNVDATGDEGFVTIIVADGKVALYGKSGQGLSGELLEGEKAVVDTRSGSVSKTINDNLNFDSYKTRNIVFNNTDLEQVIRTLSKVYNVRFEVKSPGVYQNSITVTFTDKEIDYVLRTIGETLDLDIDRKDSEIIIR